MGTDFEVIVSVRVNNGPLPGEDNRASGNFGLFAPGGLDTFRWTALGVPGPVTFDVSVDNAGASDDVILKDVTGGGLTERIGSTNLYFSNVRGASAPFNILIEGILPPPLSVTVPVNDGPLPDEDDRASQNFFIGPQDDVGALRWTVQGIPPAPVKFNLARDVIGVDPVLFDGLQSGSESIFFTGNNLYISDVTGASAPFNLLVEGVRSPTSFKLDVPVNNGPLPDQESRASENFTLPRAGFRAFKWTVRGSKDPIRFSVSRDVPASADDVLLIDLVDGSQSGLLVGSDLYISDVQGASKPFTLHIESVKL